jgi:peptidyl-prolyl cis-trans isomerase-like 3
VFGRVIHGLEVLDLFEKAPTDANNMPLTDIVLKRVTVHANPLAS